MIGCALLLLVATQTAHAFSHHRVLRRRDEPVAAQAAVGSDGTNDQAAGADAAGLGGGAIAGIVCAVAGVIGAVALLLYRRSQKQARPTHGGHIAKVVAMRGAGAMNLQGRMAVLPEEEDFHIGTQQGIITYTSELEKPPRAARPMSWYKAREAGVSPLHIQAMARSGAHPYQPEDEDTVQLHSPGAQGGSLQTPMVGAGVQIVVEQVGSRPLPQVPDASRRAHPIAQHQSSLETPRDTPSGTLDYPVASSAGPTSDVEWDSEDDEAPATAASATINVVPPTASTSPSQMDPAQIGAQLQRAPSAKFIRESAPIDPNDPSVPRHPRLFILTPGRSGMETLRQPEHWSRTTFQLRLLCEGASSDYADAHLTEEHGIAVRDPNAFMRHAARYITQTAEALIARDDDAFEQAEVFGSSTEAGEYLEMLADTLRDWFSDLLVAMEESVAEGHEVDQELLDDLRAQRTDASGSAKQELARFLAKYDPNNLNGGLRRVRVPNGHEQAVRWLCASCAAKVVQPTE
ncbi:hypothetical protein THASP1DRAFT_23067 [Thamnocephalis sphaerospora]|uniref:Uncharacterized protein n=1 Tax=Thamnocephalis sphaerospora TaxID=78915 RepID=A0A4P9XSD7_9FUNG|nr:hypothetical protein THASP1DRAFT_23067 [Thamnocephalis sphaerospora]|eukprot:RKP09054.1 hypothetical protein THASP1DRAFT_23067 [Thamnocephalis sphaerospora]